MAFGATVVASSPIGFVAPDLRDGDTVAVASVPEVPGMQSALRWAGRATRVIQTSQAWERRAGCRTPRNVIGDTRLFLSA